MDAPGHVWLAARRIAAGARGRTDAHKLRADLLAASVASPRTDGQAERRAGAAPGDWTVGAAPGRRPEAIADGAPLRRVNLTHTRGPAAVPPDGPLGCAIAVVTDGAACGVDVESLDRRVVWRRLAPRVLAESERVALDAAEAADPDAARHRFLSLWVVKEAVCKAVGHGLTVPLTGIQIDNVPETGSGTVAVSYAASIPDRASFLQLDVDVWRPSAAFVAAVALERGEGELPELPILDDVVDLRRKTGGMAGTV